MNTIRAYLGNVFDRMAELPDGSFDLIVTSPPFWRQRAYLPPDHPDKALEIGQESSPAEFIDVLLRLTAEWRRLLTPYGSIAVELGDTMAGSGGAGGDYNPIDHDAFRSGQPKWKGAGFSEYGWGKHPGHPLGKSHCYIPELYGAALTYGDWPILTGNQHSAGRWIVRNKVVWCRPNPTPGHDGDKFRRATSLITCATLNPKRYWDGDAVREVADYPDDNRHTRPDNKLNGKAGDQDGFRNSPSTGTRPLYDHWLIAPQGYPGAHYAVWTPEIARRLILTMSPTRVCVECGEPRRRIVETRTVGTYANPSPEWMEHRRRVFGSHGAEGPGGDTRREAATLGWSDCGHGHGCRPTTWKTIVTDVTQVRVAGKWVDLDEFEDEVGDLPTRVKRKRKRVVDDVGHCTDPTHWRPGNILDPFGGSGTTAAVATGNGRDCTLIDINDDNLTLTDGRIRDAHYVRHHTRDEHGATWTVDPAIPPPPKNAPYREGIRSLFDLEDIP
jgi:DNA modification methylase